jgi:glycine betaine/proline transport system permease protein
MEGQMEIGKLPIGDGIETFIDFTTTHFAFITRAMSAFIETGLDQCCRRYHVCPDSGCHPHLCGRCLAGFILADRSGHLTGLCAYLEPWPVGGHGLPLWHWCSSATCLSIGIGIPLGIITALVKPIRRVVMPVLDFMQTMPAFVYLIPAIPFFGLGPVSAIFTTMVFAMPPAIRMTSLGIQQVPKELIEAADAFGSTASQKLFKVQIPLAAPTIMAGINQTIMLSLSMVVIAAMIGAGGLGGEVWRAIQRLWMGRGFEAGIAVVIIAMILDRTTQNIKLGKWRKE